MCVNDFYTFDYILGMDYQNLYDLSKMQPSDTTADIKLLSEFDPDGEKEIQDPYFVSKLVLNMIKPDIYRILFSL